ncbi:MAG: hypothetical protein V3V22_06530 [Methylococcales bacterium]
MRPIKIWGVINVIFSLILIPIFAKWTLYGWVAVRDTLAQHPESLIAVVLVLFPVFLVLCTALILLVIITAVQFHQLKRLKINKTVSRINIFICAKNSLFIILLLKFYPIHSIFS